MRGREKECGAEWTSSPNSFVVSAVDLNPDNVTDKVIDNGELGVILNAHAGNLFNAQLPTSNAQLSKAEQETALTPETHTTSGLMAVNSLTDTASSEIRIVHVYRG